MLDWKCMVVLEVLARCVNAMFHYDFAFVWSSIREALLLLQTFVLHLVCCSAESAKACKYHVRAGLRMSVRNNSVQLVCDKTRLNLRLWRWSS